MIARFSENQTYFYLYNPKVKIRSVFSFFSLIHLSLRSQKFMAKQPLIKQDGTILEALSNAMFRVKLENGHEISGHYFRKNEDALYQDFAG